MLETIINLCLVEKWEAVSSNFCIHLYIENFFKTSYIAIVHNFDKFMIWLVDFCEIVSFKNQLIVAIFKEGASEKFCPF